MVNYIYSIVRQYRGSSALGSGAWLRRPPTWPLLCLTVNAMRFVTRCFGASGVYSIQESM